MALFWMVKILIFASAVVAIWGSELESSNPVAEEGKPETTNWTVDFIRNTGYEVETHEVTTEDGYILTLHRIPSFNGRGRPVLLHHGFLGRSADFVVLGHQNSLGFILANKGYDVWMANARGSTNSKRHQTLKSSYRAFWDFSWHEIGYYDIPAEIDYILDQTGNEKLTFIGFSTGTSAFLVTMSTRPEYNSKVDKMIALGPVSFMEHVRGPIMKWIAPLTARMSWVLSIFGKGEFLPTSSFMTWAAKKFCADDSDTQRLCQNVLFLFYGYDSPKMNGDLVERIFEYSPSGGSTKQFLHTAQLVLSAPTFRMYDYGFLKNLFIYRRTSPPEYQLKQVTTPVHLFMAENDWFADRADVIRLSMRLPNVKTVSLVKRENFNHFDFVYASDARELCYRDVVRILED